MNEKSILNYPGSKKRLLQFILDNSKPYIDNSKYVLDIFTGTGIVAKTFQDHGYLVGANDVELYSYNIARSILNQSQDIDIEIFESFYKTNKKKLINEFRNELEQESKYLSEVDTRIINFEKKLYKIWRNDSEICINGTTIANITELNSKIDQLPFCLFTLYYSGYYFGLSQSIEIDSIRYAIEKYGRAKEDLLLCLYFAMKEACFSKDGHMAQPLNPAKNFERLLKVRVKQIFPIFTKKLLEITRVTHSNTSRNALTYNLSFDELLKVKEIANKVGFIYADPPYTDMQYSRYFHLLNTISDYSYPEMTIRFGKITTGLYANNRYQSKISTKSKSLSELTTLMEFSATNNITLAFSYAYPININHQAVNRYTMKIDDLINSMSEVFSKVDVFREEYEHSNHRNSEKKQVFEYLVIGSQQ